MQTNTEANEQHKSNFDRLDINVKIDGEQITLSIDREDEEAVRAAAVDVNRVLSLYRQRYSSDRTPHGDILRYTALHFATLLQSILIERKEANASDRLKALSDRVNRLITSSIDVLGDNDR